MQDADEIIAVRAGDGSPHSSDYDIGDDTKSIESSVTRYRMENGRRYHGYKDGVYWQPNDERQNETLEVAHIKFLLALGGKLLLAPIESNIERALDVGTGTGIWAIDFADEYPETHVIGTDLSPIQPNMVPENCEFFVDDCRDSWTFPPNHFDFVHIRSLFGSIEDWPGLYQQVYRHLKPGGYIEQVEISINLRSDDDTVGPDSPLVKFRELFEEAGNITGCTFHVSEIMKDQIIAAGFTNVVEKVIKTPIGQWPEDRAMRRLGQYAGHGFDIGLEGYALATLTRVLNWSPNEVYILLAQIRAAAKDPEVHCYYDIKVVYAQKPLQPSAASPTSHTAPPAAAPT